MNKNGLLIFGKHKFRCALGKSGTKKNKVEGDKATPVGIFSLGKIYYRSDRIKKLKVNLKVRKIRKNMGWCNDPQHSKYNTEIDLNLIEPYVHIESVDQNSVFCSIFDIYIDKI